MLNCQETCRYVYCTSSIVYYGINMNPAPAQNCHFIEIRINIDTVRTMQIYDIVIA